MGKCDSPLDAEEDEKEGGGWADADGVEDVAPPSITSADFLKWRAEKNESILELQLIQLPSTDRSILRFIHRVETERQRGERFQSSLK